MPRGGKRTGAGRKKGSVTKATADIKAYAQQYSEEAIDKLIEIMRHKDTPSATARAAANDLLDRAHGRPAQAVVADDGGPLFPSKIEVVLVSPKTKG